MELFGCCFNTEASRGNAALLRLYSCGIKLFVVIMQLMLLRRVIPDRYLVLHINPLSFLYSIVSLLLGGMPNLGGLDIGSLLSNPAVMNMVGIIVNDYLGCMKWLNAFSK